MEQDNAAPRPAEVSTMESKIDPVGDNPSDRNDGNESSKSSRKKRKWQNHKLQHGSRSKKRNLGRNEFFRDNPDKRDRVERTETARQKRETEGGVWKDSILPKAFTKEEIEAEDRKPKRKVAVLIGYSGSGYKGMQINTTERTIEGDLFTAFVKAGAISKANADDPKKSALVRCARTDKGVHAAGNVISLKLIIEDDEIVEKINSHLSSQIRVWGIQRTIGSFSCYQACDSRWYEYLIPSHCFIPPHPSSFLGRKLVEAADQAGKKQEYEQRQEEVMAFWDEIEVHHIKPILSGLDVHVRRFVEKALYAVDADGEVFEEVSKDTHSEPTSGIQTDTKAIIGEQLEASKDEMIAENPSSTDDQHDTNSAETKARKPAGDKELKAAVKQLKAAYNKVKNAYRIPQKRLERIQDALNEFLGTHNFHNYTIQKSFRDPSAKRHIKSFAINGKPVIINETEWISIKIHGQSFMMHQIRKMIGMIALLVRCGCPLERIQETFGDVDVAIPKAPGLGLLLERPCFDTYNSGAAEKFGRDPIDFEKYEKEIQEFKEREIYERIFKEEEQSNEFHRFFSNVDNYRQPHFLWLTLAGIQASIDAIAKSKGKLDKQKLVGLDSDDEGEASRGGEEG